MTSKFFGKSVVRVSNDPGNAIGFVIKVGAGETPITPAQHGLAKQLAKAGNTGLKITTETAAFDVAAVNRAGLRASYNNVTRQAVMHAELNEPVGFLIDADATVPGTVERAPWPGLTREVVQPDTRSPWERAKR